jgi:N-acetylglucosamine kinase-like BadF-type ATPase
VKSTRLYLGIDGGQSSTTALIADETGRIIGQGRGGPCNHVASAERQAKFLSVVGGCLQQACQQAGLEASTVSFSAACFGFSGGAEDKEMCSRQLVASAQYKFTHDAEIALTGATEGEPGIICIAGTGSMAFGRNAARAAARAGGWGYLFGDEGGAFDLIRRALRAALQSEEGWGPPTALRVALLQATGAPDANALMHRFYNEFSRSTIASLAPLVTEAADQGDAVAIEIVDRAARKLTWFVGGVHQQLFRAREAVPVAYTGGVFRSPLFRDAFARHVYDTIVCQAVAPQFGPAAGAILEALRLDGNRSRLSALPQSEK